ncbi:MAG: Cytochrome c [Verrucomicrobiaceae bacterium]|nr:Cytochrome c [Verrucomicrobiaceae bacterium]
MKTILISLAFSFVGGWLAQSAPVSITLPVEVAALRNAPGAELAAMHCMTCHSAEYINSQPSLTRTAWKASVEKMRGKFAAPIPEDQVEKLADYLAAIYGMPEPVK